MKLSAIFLTVLLVLGCSMDAEHPSITGPSGEGGEPTQIELSMIPNFPILSADLYPDIPPDAEVYGMGTLFYPQWNGNFNSKVNLGITWSEIGTLKIHRWIVIGSEYTVALYVDGRTIVEGIMIKGVELTNYELDGEPPYSFYGHMWAAFSLGIDPTTSELYVYQGGEDDRERMASIRVVYDGWSESIPDSCAYLNGPPADPSYPAFFQSNLSWGQDTPLYWQAEGAYAKWYRAFATGDSSDYYMVVTVTGGQDPYRRTWGIYAGPTELHYFFRLSEQWYAFIAGFNPDGSVNQPGDDNRCGPTN